MKTNLLTFALLLCATFAAKAQFVTIPDSAFSAYLQQVYPSCMNGNQMDTTCFDIVNTLGQNLSNKSIASIEGIQYFDNLVQLYCDYNQITSIVALPPTLRIFVCNNNSITSLPTTLPPSLYHLDCSHNQLSSLPALPVTLNMLNCDQNTLTSLPALSDSLELLFCSNNSLITTLPALPAHLKHLSANFMSLSSLPQLPPNLVFLSCSGNQLLTIPVLPNTVQNLNFSNNAVSVMPAYPDSLTNLSFSATDITVIPTLPQTITSLSCAYNNLSTLPALPQGLYSLHCNHNALTFIPELPNLKFLFCGENDLTQIGPFSDTMQSLSCSGNPNLTCLPRIKHMWQNLLFSNTAITCLPNYFSVSGVSIPLADTFPLCDQFNNPNGCAIYANLSGRSYADRNNNCLFDSTDAGQFGLKHSLYSNGALLEQTYSNNAGNYSFDVTAFDNYETRLDTTGLPFIIACPTGGVYYDTLTANDSLHFNRDFALQCKTGFDLAARSVASAMVFRPANNTVVDIHAGDLANFYSASCAQGVSGVVTVTLNGPMTYISPAPGAIAPSNVTNNVITWNVADFGTADGLHDFNIIIQTDTFAQGGQQACFDVMITPLTGDNDTSNNHLYYCFDIVNSYDPNDKTAYPAGNIDTLQEWLTYTVRFQNTGTAEAQHIYIMDTLDANTSAGTFQLLSYSHQPNVQLNENIVRFNFPFINLPDSNSNEPGSHGYVQYKVKLKNDLPIGTTINNTAYIYFDFNPPVVTNTATNTVAVDIETGIVVTNKSFNLMVYPNPANQQLTVTTSEAGQAIAIYNTQGKLISTQTMQGNAETLNVAALPSGVYYIEVSGKNNTARKKFVKL